MYFYRLLWNETTKTDQMSIKYVIISLTITRRVKLMNRIKRSQEKYEQLFLKEQTVDVHDPELWHNYKD